ncbi:MAG: helix-turn-helix transcriptional regulator [Clostridia bacterium]
MLTDYMQQRNITKYRLAKNTGIPYTTLTDILSGKTDLRKCNVETVYKLAKEFQITIETLISPYLETRCNFELYKSNVCHRLKRLGDTNFLINTLESNEIRKYYNLKWYPECFYLLAMVDYISRINNVPLCDEYSDLRSQYLSEKIYPSSIIAISNVSDSNLAKEKAEKNSIPEFLKFNIIESEVRNVI